MGQALRWCFVLLLLACPASAMVENKDGATLSKEEVTVIVDTITKQQEQIKALQRRLTTCFQNT